MVKEIIFRNKTYKNLGECIDYIHSLKYSKVKNEKIVLTMSVEQMQKEFEKATKEIFKDILEPIVEELKELYL
jgi:hypothetical protein